MIDTFDIPPSIEDFARYHPTIQNRNLVESTVSGKPRSLSTHLNGQTTSLLGDNIKVSVYKSPDVVIKQPELIT